MIEGLYIHVPFCDGKCHYCAFYSVPYSPARGSAWLAALKRELDAALLQSGPFSLSTIFLGGGTPTILPMDLLEELLGAINRSRTVAASSPVMEWTSEANPGSVDLEKLAMMRSLGVNRISLGVQSFDDRVLRQLGRRHKVQDVIAAVEAVQEAGYTNWSVDLIACVPGVSQAEWRETLRVALALNPPHMSVYALTSEEGSLLELDRKEGRASLLDDDEQLAMLAEAASMLQSAGLNQYEISNFARPGFECRHNVSCWRGGDYLGLGCAAASRVGNRRWVNTPNLESYLAAGTRDEEVLTPLTDAVERLVFGLRMTEGVDLDAILEQTGVTASGQATQWRMTLGRLQEEGMVVHDGPRWRLTKNGLALADHVAVELMP